MQIKDQELWNRCLENNQDGYGRAINSYAERWADLMEEYLQQDMTIKEMADKASHEADIEGITGFMYGAAVATLASVWLHGEELRQWHNLKTQILDEGEKANEKPGAVLNPAILNIG